MYNLLMATFLFGAAFGALLLVGILMLAQSWFRQVGGSDHDGDPR